MAVANSVVGQRALVWTSNARRAFGHLSRGAECDQQVLDYLEDCRVDGLSPVTAAKEVAEFYGLRE